MAVAPDVKNKLPALPGADLYMSAKTIGKVFDLNKCNSRIKTFLKTLMFDPVNMRPTDSWIVEEDWKDLIRICFGEPRFFQMKIKES